MPIEFTQYPPQENTGVSGDTLYKMAMAYDGTGRRISKTRWVKARGDAGWQRRHVTHYTGIGTEVRENFAGESPETKVVVNMPQGLGRYGIEDADHAAESASAQTFEWYLKNHLGSTMLVYGTGGTSGGLKAAYDYRSFGEQIELTSPSTGKVTENFTGKERDDETELSYHEARYLDPMLGVWISVDPKRFFPSPYLYMGNGYNPIRFADLNGQEPGDVYVFNSDGEKPGNFIVKLHRGQGPGFSHAAIETKDGRLFSADEDGVGVKDKSIALKGRTGVILRPKQKLNIDAMQKFIDDAQGGVYFVNGVCSSNVVDALEAGGLKLREDWTLLELIKDPPKIIKTVPHPAVLLEYPELEQVDYFREEPNDLKDAN